jgi:ectoine hydroxylase
MSIALTDHHPFNGGLMMMPGSHRTFVPCAGRTPLEHYRSPIVDHEIGVPSTEHLTSLASAYGIEQFTGPAGSALMFDANLMHGSGNNITPFPRSHIYLVFNSAENVLVDPFGGTSPRPIHVADRDFTPLSR